MTARIQTDQPQALSLCAARGDRADREGRFLRADRYRSCQQAGLVSGDLAARQDAGAAGRRHRDFRIRRHPGISRGNPAEAAASGRSLEARRASRLDRIRIGCAQRYRGLLRRAGRSDIQGQDIATRAALCAARSARQGLAMVRRRKTSRWSMRCSVRCFAISMCSTRSPISEFSRASRNWRAGAAALAARPSVRSAVSADYPALLRAFHRPAEFLDIRPAGAHRGLTGCRRRLDRAIRFPGTQVADRKAAAYWITRFRG